MRAWRAESFGEAVDVLELVDVPETAPAFRDFARALRGRGIARQLMQHLLRWFANRGVGCVLLQTTEAAGTLYQALATRPCSSTRKVERRTPMLVLP